MLLPLPNGATDIVCGEVQYNQVWMKVSAPHPLSDTTPVGTEGHLITVRVGWKPRFPTQPLLMGLRWDHSFFSMVFDWSGVGFFSQKFSVMLGFPFLVSGWKEQALLGALKKSAPIGILGCQLTQASIQKTKRKSLLCLSSGGSVLSGTVFCPTLSLIFVL